jgi:putative phosphoribosyl transferase
MIMFRDRVDAGRHLATALQDAGIGGGDVVVLGLPRGGVPVAAEVAHALCAPLDVIIVRKLGLPSQPELAIGAIGEDGVRVENAQVMESVRMILDDVDIDAIEQRERAEIARRAGRYRQERARLELKRRCAVIVDDGIATGSTAHAACRVARAHGASRVVLAVPVAPKASAAMLRAVCDEFVCVFSPESFSAVGEWYGDFSPTSDDEVVEILRRST